MSAKPTTILIATDEDKDKQIAKYKADHEEDEKKMTAMDEEHEKMESKLKAAQEKEVPATPGPVVKAIIAMMDDDHKEEAKKAFLKAMDEEHDEKKKESMKKAMEEIFETGNGVNTNAQETEKEKEQEAVIAMLSAKVGASTVKKILTAKQLSGAKEEDLKTEQKRLIGLTLPKLEEEYKSQEIFINKALQGSTKSEQEHSLVASVESTFDFNGTQGMALVGKAIDIDEAIEEAAAQ